MAHGKDKRLDNRHGVRRVVIEIENESYQVTDISLGGCFFEGAHNKWPPGTVIKATLVMPQGNRTKIGLT